jgi:hypothetical protein
MGYLLNIPGARFDSRTWELDVLAATLSVLCEAGVVLGTVHPDVMVSRHRVSGKPPRRSTGMFGRGGVQEDKFLGRRPGHGVGLKEALRYLAARRRSFR